MVKSLAYLSSVNMADFFDLELGGRQAPQNPCGVIILPNYGKKR